MCYNDLELRSEVMETIKIMTDSSSGISQEEADQLGIAVVPMPITIDRTEYMDGIDLFYHDAVAHLREHHEFKTAQPLPRDLIGRWETYLEQYDKIVYIPISSALSGSYVNACVLANSFDGRVVVVDAKAVEALLRYVCLEAVRMVDEGKKANEIRDVLEANYEDTYAIIVPENVDQLKRGGRITPTAAAVANLLKIQPILKIEHGKVDLHSKVRTLRKAYQEAMHHVLQVDHADQYYWFMIQVDQEECQELKAEFEQRLGHNVPLFRFTPIVMAHTGLKTIGFGRTRKYQ